MARLQLYLLGPFQGTLDDVPLSRFRSDKSRALLAYLAVEAGRPHRREALAGLLWGAYNDRAARTSLRKALSNLRKVLAPLLEDEAERPLLTITRQNVAIDPDHRDLWVDTAAFAGLLATCETHPHPDVARCSACAARLATAAEQYRGDFLAGLHLAGTLAFDEWRLLQQERFHQQITAALTTLMAYHASLDDYEQLQKYAQRQLELTPWNEEAHRQLMAALAHSGQRSEALAQYERCRETLAESLGVEPDTETVALYEAIRSADFPAVASAIHAAPQTLPPHNLPQQTTPFIGRTAVLTTLKKQLLDPAYRLVTIVGEGGVGKTRLALAAARETLRHFTQGAWFVSLAGDEETPQNLVPAIAHALHFTLQGEGTPLAQLLDYLRQKEVLLVLDNLEPFLKGARAATTADLIQNILDNTPGVTLLLTSRERLNMQAEYALRLEGLPVPGDSEKSAAAASVQLFVERAGRSPSGFALDDNHLPAVVEICRLVEGLPLAIELAATWVEQFTCAEIAATMRQNLDFLATRQWDLPARHRSIRAAFAYSWRLLSPQEQLVLAQASIFRGPFSREALLAVAGAQLPDLVSLVDKSLLRPQSPGRYALHALVRQFAAEKLEMPPWKAERERVAQRHSAYYLDFVAQQTADLRGDEPQKATAEIGNALDNVRRAWQWSVAQEDVAAIGRATVALSRFYLNARFYEDGEAMLRMAIGRLQGAAETTAIPRERRQALCRLLAEQAYFLHQQDRYQEASTAVRQSIQLAEMAQNGALAANAYAVAGMILASRGEATPAKEHLERALALAQQANLPLVEADSSRILGTLFWQQGDYEEATACHQRALRLSREAEDVWGQSQASYNLANAFYYREKYAEARHYYQESLELTRRSGDRAGEAVTLINLAIFDKDEGNVVVARDRLQQALAICREVGLGRREAVALNNLGLVLDELGRFSEGVACYRRALRLFEEIGYRRGEAYGFLYLGLTSHHLQDDASAYEYVGRSLQISKEIDERHCQGLALTVLGHVLVELGRLETAVTTYQQAISLRRKTGPAKFVIEPLAGLARVLWLQGEPAQAQAHVEEVLALLQNQSLGGPAVPLLVYLTCYRVLRDNDDARATAILQKARAQLQEKAAKIEDEDLRHSFLENLAVHQEILKESGRDG